MKKALLYFIFGLCIFTSLHTYAQIWQNVGSSGFSSSQVDYTNIAIDRNNIPYVVYKDFANNEKATVMTYNGSSWVPLGIPGFSIGIIDWPSIAIDPSGTPYVVYQDHWCTNGFGATVMKYNGSAWVNVGSPGFSIGMVTNTKIAIDASGTPYVVYEDYFGPSGPTTVMKSIGNGWVVVGYTEFSAGPAGWPSIAIDTGGTPYVVYADADNNVKASVMKYDGSNWVYVGNPGFSDSSARYTTIAIDRNGTPYVAYTNGSYTLINNMINVMKYDGSNWVTVGSPLSSTAAATYITLAIDSVGIPYVGYSDANHNAKATVMKYNGSNWVIVGNADFSAGGTCFTSLALDRNGTPYMCYIDSAYGNKATVMKFDTTLPPITGIDTVCMGGTTALSCPISGGAWCSSNTNIATVGTTGIVTGLAAGTATISYTVSGYSCTLTMVVNSCLLPPIIGADSLCVGSIATLSDLTNGGTWSSSNAIIATIGTTGIVTGIAAGTVLISYTVSGYSATLTMVIDSCLFYKKLPTTLFPNPNHGSFTLNISSPIKEDATIIITNMLGEKIKEITATTNTDAQIQLDSPPGIYFILAVTAHGRQNGKVVVW